MPGTTPGQGWRIPVSTDDPDVVDDVTQLANLIEKRVMGVYATPAARDTAAAAMVVEEGMFAFTKDLNKVWFYDGAAWVAFPTAQPAITSGTTAPSGGASGDIYFRV